MHLTIYFFNTHARRETKRILPSIISPEDLDEEDCVVDRRRRLKDNELGGPDTTMARAGKRQQWAVTLLLFPLVILFFVSYMYISSIFTLLTWFFSLWQIFHSFTHIFLPSKCQYLKKFSRERGRINY